MTCAIEGTTCAIQGMTCAKRSFAFGSSAMARNMQGEIRCTK